MLLSPVVGREQGGLRPALVVSHDDYNATPHGLRLVVPVRPPEGGLTKPSVLLCDQVRASSLFRFRRRRVSISNDTLTQAQRVIRELVDG